jgi:thiol-disulfide isomerase/thioredoxin
MKIVVTLFFILFINNSFSQDNCSLLRNKLDNIKIVDVNDLQCISRQSKNENTIVYTFGIWCAPCRLHLKNAINLKYQYDVNLLILLIEPETDRIIQSTIDYIHKIDSKIEIVLLKDKYGKKRGKKYKNFLKEITPKKFENLNGMSKYLVFNKKGEIEMITTWKDNRNNDWKDDSNMIKDKIVPLLRHK